MRRGSRDKRGRFGESITKEVGMVITQHFGQILGWWEVFRWIGLSDYILYQKNKEAYIAKGEPRIFFW